MHQYICQERQGGFLMFRLYKVGGCVRDHFLGRKSKDIDYTVVNTDGVKTIEHVFADMVYHLDQQGFKRFLTTEECVTVRAKFPNSSEVADFVLARKEVGYKPGTRIPLVIPGTLYDDLERRDFTVNAMAVANDGKLIDPFDGMSDLKAGVLRTPLDPMVTLTDDPLRAIRAIRFAITLNFRMSDQLLNAMFHRDLPGLTKLVSTDRIREELQKCFKADTWNTLKVLQQLPEELTKEWLTREGMWLMPTTKR